MGYLVLSGGLGDNASAPNIAAYQFLADVDLTVEVWFTMDDFTPAARMQLVSNASGAFTSGWSIYVEPTGGVRYRYHDGAGKNESVGSVAALTPGQLYHLAVTHDFGGNAVESYLDGVSLNSGNGGGVTAGFTAAVNPLRAGAQGSGASLLAGQIHAVVVAQGIATQPNIAAATPGNPAAGTTVVYDADFTDLTVGEVVAGSFVEDSANAATVTLNGTGWLYSGLIAVTGSAATAPTLESEIVVGMHTIVLTLTGDEWVATVGDDNGITTALIAGIDSDGVEVGGWDAVVRANMVFGDVTRLNDTTVQIILGDEPTYAIDADETITVTVPATALAAAGAVVATPTFDITAEDPVATRRVISSPRYGITRMARR